MRLCQYEAFIAMHQPIAGEAPDNTRKNRRKKRPKMNTQYLLVSEAPGVQSSNTLEISESRDVCLGGAHAWKFHFS